MALTTAQTGDRAGRGGDSHDGAGLSHAGRLVTLDGDLPATPPTWHHAPVLDARSLSDRYHFLRLHAPTIAGSTRPGQFVMLGAARAGADEPVLPRPMAIFSADPVAGTIDVVYGVVGRGTRSLATFARGQRMLTIGPLGRGFQLLGSTTHVLLVGRGIGTCSLTTVAPAAVRSGLEVTAVISGRHPGALIGAVEYLRAGVDRVIEVTDVDGSSDVDGLAGRLRKEIGTGRPPEQIFTCGSDRLARMCLALAGEWGSQVQVSLEAHMACGLGYCHGCSSGQRTAEAETPLVCTQGPVFQLVARGPARAGTP